MRQRLSVEAELEEGFVIWVLLISSAVFAILSYALWNGLYLGEPDIPFARAEAIFLFILGTLSLFVSCWKMRRGLRKS